jgi:hypothetical protein
VADRWAVVVGIDKPLHPEFAPTPFAEADARAVAAALERTGVPDARRVLLAGQFATKAAVESRLRRLRKQVKKGDELVLFWAGRGGASEAGSHLVCWDTLPDDAPATAVAVADLVAVGAKAAQTVVLLAADALDHRELRDLFADTPNAACLSACGPDEEPHAPAATKAGLWTQLVVEALSGLARKAAERDGWLTAGGVQRYAEEELPRRLRKHFEAGVTQTPAIYGDGELALATLPTVAAEGVLDPARLRRVVFRTEERVKVKDLADFRKTYSVPDNAGPSNRKFVARIATADIRAELDRVYDAAREHLGYKRKDLDVKAEQDGTGYLRTPDFEYTVYADLDPDEPSKLIWRREAGQFADPGFVRSAGFNELFPGTFDRLVFEFARPIDVGEFVDRVEDSPPAGAKLTVTSDGKACDITLAGFAGTVRVQRHAVTVRGRAADASGLLDRFLQFLGKFGAVGELPALPPVP